MIETHIIRVLIHIGTDCNVPGELNHRDIALLKSYEHIDRAGLDAWGKATKDLRNEEVIALIRGLTIVERELRWCGGSVSPVIWLFRNLESTVDISIYEELADWILKITHNRFLPFGSNNFGAESFADYKKMVFRRRSIQLAAKKKRKTSEEDARNQRIIRASQRERSANDRYSSIRQQLIQEFSQLSIQEQLGRIATDEVYSVNFYPTRSAKAATSSILESLDYDLLLSLRMKMKGKHKGPWGSFKKRLMRVLGIP